MHEDITAFPHSGDKAKKPFEVAMCGISYCDGSYRINRPDSYVWCLEYIIKGGGCVNVDDTSFRAEEGDVYILPAGRNHYYYSDSENPWEKIWMNVRGELTESLAECYKLQNIYHIRGADVYGIFREFLDTARAAQSPDEASEKCALCFLKLMQYLSAHGGTERKKPASEVAARLKARLDSVTDFNESLDKITEDVYCTKAHAIRVFKAEYGITPYNYLLGKKLSVAKQLLSGTGMSVREISEYLGFSDCHYFSAFFRKQTGVSPRSYRK